MATLATVGLDNRSILSSGLLQVSCHQLPSFTYHVSRALLNKTLRGGYRWLFTNQEHAFVFNLSDQVVSNEDQRVNQISTGRELPGAPGDAASRSP